MADRQLNINQQIALLPVAIPDSILDLLEDFNYTAALQTETVRASFDPAYLKAEGENLTKNLEVLRAEMGKLVQLHVDAAGKEFPGIFLLKLTFEKGSRGMGIITKVKERTISKLHIQAGAYDEATLKADAAKSFA